MEKKELKKCKYCSSEISNDASVCPVCKRDLRNWFIKHWIISLILISIIVTPFINWFEEWFNNKSDNIIESNEEINHMKSIEEIVKSEYKNFFDSDWLNKELKNKLLDEFSNNKVNIKRAQFFISDDKKQIILNTVFTIDGKEYASNSRHNIKTNKIEEFYYSEY